MLGCTIRYSISASYNLQHITQKRFSKRTLSIKRKVKTVRGMLRETGGWAAHLLYGIVIVKREDTVTMCTNSADGMAGRSVGRWYYDEQFQKLWAPT